MFPKVEELNKMRNQLPVLRDLQPQYNFKTSGKLSTDRRQKVVNNHREVGRLCSCQMVTDLCKCQKISWHSFTCFRAPRRTELNTMLSSINSWNGNGQRKC